MLYTTQDHLLRVGTTQSDLGPFISIINQENAPQSRLQSSLIGDILFRLRFFFSRMALACVRLINQAVHKVMALHPEGHGGDVLVG